MNRPLEGVKSLADKLEHAKLSRRAMLKRTAVLGVSVPTMGALIAACAEDDDVEDLTDDDPDVAAEEPDDDVDVDEPDDDEPDVDDEDVEEEPDVEDDDEEDEVVEDDEEARYGGTLHTTLVGDPPHMDTMSGTQILVRYFANHVTEHLFTRDDDFQIIPHLADSHEVSDDGLTNTVTLREGVPFHNGEEMTSEDVIASMERFMEVSGMGATFGESVDDIEAADDYTIEVQMNTPLGTFAPMLASHMGGGCPIYPASVLAEAEGETGPLSDIISTGPYQLVEWASDTHVHMQRFEDYASRDEEPMGYGGGKKQYLDEIYFHIVPDEAARIAGLQAGDYHFLDDISPDHLSTFDDDDDIIAEPEPFTWMSLVLNTAQGVMSDVRMRQALQACLNHEEILRAGYGDHFRLDPSLILQEMVWHTEAGGELYDQRDPDRAQQLMEEAGYDGEEIVFLTTSEYTDRYNASLMAAQQMRDVGMNVREDVYDWATVGERREDPELWDLFYTSIGGIDPALTVFVASNTWPGWWDTEPKTELAAQLREETDFDARYALFEELQELFYEEVPVIKLGDIYQIYARSNRVQGFVPLIQQGAFLWNVWLEDE